MNPNTNSEKKTRESKKHGTVKFRCVLVYLSDDSYVWQSATVTHFSWKWSRIMFTSLCKLTFWNAPQREDMKVMLLCWILFFMGYSAIKPLWYSPSFEQRSQSSQSSKSTNRSINLSTNKSINQSINHYIQYRLDLFFRNGLFATSYLWGFYIVVLSIYWNT